LLADLFFNRIGIFIVGYFKTTKKTNHAEKLNVRDFFPFSVHQDDYEQQGTGQCPKIDSRKESQKTQKEVMFLCVLRFFVAEKQYGIKNSQRKTLIAIGVGARCIVPNLRAGSMAPLRMLSDKSHLLLVFCLKRSAP